ncbi:hypothetical protein [Slackia piriformis]|uniref:hypothetical protein n=1 Tax=Slackia piriformis TaxID=626934 RepID=UPI002F955331
MPLWSAVKEGRCCIGKVTKFDASGFAGSVAAEIPDFDPVACGLSKKEARRFAPVRPVRHRCGRRGHGPKRPLRRRGRRLPHGVRVGKWNRRP